MRMLWDDKWRAAGATVTSSTEQGNFPATNSQDTRSSKTWRSGTGILDAWLTLDAGAAVTADAVAVVGHNATATATITLEGNTSPAWPGALVETLTWRNGIILHYFTSAAYRYWRVRVQDVGNADNHIALGRVVLAPRLQLTVDGRSVVSDFPESRVRDDRQSYALSGELYADIGTEHREYAYQFRNVPESLRQLMLSMFTGVGKHTPVVLAHRDTDFGVFEPMHAVVGNDLQFSWLGADRWDFDLQLREVV